MMIIIIDELDGHTIIRLLEQNDQLKLALLQMDYYSLSHDLETSFMFIVSVVRKPLCSKGVDTKLSVAAFVRVRIVISILYGFH